MNIKHLDTLVGPRPPDHQRIYDIVLKAAYGLAHDDEELIDDNISVLRFWDGHQSVLAIRYNDRVEACYSDNISSYTNIPGLIKRITPLDRICKIMTWHYCGFRPKPWEVN